MASPTDLEVQRAQRMAQNRRKMEEMGLVEASRGLAASGTAAAAVALEAGVERAPRLKRRRVERAQQPAEVEPTRLSRRLRGKDALPLEQAVAEGQAEAEAMGRARKAASRKRLTLPEGQQLAAPFSLWSIGVTVWELGHVHRGSWAHRYWSNPGCLYHHAYPVGYRATKVQFGRTYEMRIEEGPAGPLFKVIDQQSGAVFSGESPTKPWTDVCIAHRTGQRISGPLFFGFSDAVTQRAIAANLYSDAELRAALQGERIEVSAAATPQERAAHEFMSVEGIGEATAIALSKTVALGGAAHGGLASLRDWAGAADGNAQLLLDFLTTSSELSEGTRRWPAWRPRIAPKIVWALSGRWFGTGPSPAAAGEGGGAGGPAPQQEQQQQHEQEWEQEPQREQPRPQQQAVQQPWQLDQRPATSAGMAASGDAAKENRQPKPGKAQAAPAPQARSRRERRSAPAARLGGDFYDPDDFED